MHLESRCSRREGSHEHDVGEGYEAEVLLKPSQILNLETLALYELRTEDFCQVCRAYLAVQTYLLKDRLICKLFFHMLRNKD